MSLDAALINSLRPDSFRIQVIDSSGFESGDGELLWSSGEREDIIFGTDDIILLHPDADLNESILNFNSSSGVADVAVISVSYLKNGAVVGSSLVQNGNCELRLLKYKVELPRGAKVTLFDDETIEAQFVAWNLPCPNTLPNMTFLQVKAANGFEQQITPSAGSYSVEVWTELGRRYAVFGEIWTYSFAQVLWFADLKIQLSNYDWVDVVPTAGEGGTIVTALPQ